METYSCLICGNGLSHDEYFVHMYEVHNGNLYITQNVVKHTRHQPLSRFQHIRLHSATVNHITLNRLAIENKVVLSMDVNLALFHVFIKFSQFVRGRNPHRCRLISKKCSFAQWKLATRLMSIHLARDTHCVQ